MAETLSITKLDQATRMLAEVRTIDDAKQLIDLAEAARVYARQVELGLQAQNHAAEIKLRAQRRAGEILDKIDGAQGARTDLTSVQTEQKLKTEVYQDAGINNRDAHIWQTIAAMPEEKFEESLADIRQAGLELSTAKIYREAKREKAKVEKVDKPFPSGKYRVIYADPPWQYSDKLVDGYGPAEFHYPTMPLMDLCELPIQNLSEDNAVLFIWCTSPLLQECFEIISSWGFEYKTSFVWDKVKHNFGHYNSVRHEFLLVCTRGSCTPDNPKLYDSVQTIERTEHSRKPEEFRQIIDALYPIGKRIELFSRCKVDGWEAWGNE